MKMASTTAVALALAAARIRFLPGAFAFVTPVVGGTNRATWAVASTRAQQQQDPLPPWDETSNPIATVREMLAAPDAPEGTANRFDGVGGSSGGIWRSRVYGLLPATVIDAREGTKWMTKEEAAGNLYQDWLESTIQVVGEKAVSNLGTQHEVHTIVRRVYGEALSPKAILRLQPLLEASLGRLVLRWEELAETGQQKLTMQDDLRRFSLESIAGAFFGDYATPRFIEDTGRLLPILSQGLISIPFRFPPPLNKLPMLGFGLSMDAREELKGVIRDALHRRRADLASGEGTSKNPGVLDSFFDLQDQQQMGAEGALDGSFSFDDDFIIDNGVVALFGGIDTTSVTLTRMLQLLGTSEDGKEIMDQLIDELNNDATSGDIALEGGAASSVGTLESLPLLEALVLESTRLYPAIAGLFRKARKDFSYNGYLIPEGQTINWNLIHGSRAEKLYPEPEKFCPFRFLHGDEKKDADSAASPGTGARSPGQPIPPMWGFGKHMCPGRDLAKLEMVLFMKTFLAEFDFEVMEGQSFKSTLPTGGPKDKLRIILKAKPATAATTVPRTKSIVTS
ncbi:unnamed protein product [Ectocarpus sp. 8 AP-2014]